MERGSPPTDLPRGPTGDEIRKVRLLARGKPAVIVRGGTADRGEMVRVDVFTKANKRGKDEFYLVPVYPHQVMDKAGCPTPPMKSVVAYKDEDTGWDANRRHLLVPLQPLRPQLCGNG